MAELSAYRRRKIQDELMGAIHCELAPLAMPYVTFSGTLGNRESPLRVGYGAATEDNGYFRDGVSITLAEVNRKVSPKPDGYGEATWERKGTFRLSVHGSVEGNYKGMPTKNLQQLKDGYFNYEAVARAVGGQFRFIKDFADKRDASRKLAQTFEKTATKLDQEFELSKTFSKEEGWPRIELDHDEWGLTLHVHTKMTEFEVRTILQTVRELGMLPGGVRKGELEPKVLSRFERIE